MQETTVNAVLQIIEDRIGLDADDAFKEYGVTKRDFNAVLDILRSYNAYGLPDDEHGWCILTAKEAKETIR